MPEARPITLLLRDFAQGDKTALDRLVPLVYTELRRIADGHLRRERRGHTLQPTALVHEAYARMVGQDQPEYGNRTQFLGIAAQVMRQILIDHARSKTAKKRGGGQESFALDEARDAAMERPASLVAIDDALTTLTKQDPQKARLVELRFFGGLTAEESAELLNLPVQTIRRELRVAQAWLRRELDRTQPLPE
jgi:RNA polymerase sigma factor (TIGR02999 family)